MKAETEVAQPEAKETQNHHKPRKPRTPRSQGNSEPPEAARDKDLPPGDFRESMVWSTP
jgi:hypothetical protein